MSNENKNLPCGISEMNLQKLECPFTWAMEIVNKKLMGDTTDYTIDNQDQNDFNEYTPLDDVEDLIYLMKHIMLAYVNTKAKSDSTEILNELKKCDIRLKGFEKCNHSEVSFDVVRFILQSTKIFIFKELNLTNELNESVLEIKQDWQLTSKETSTLLACRGICWWVCNLIPVFECEHFIRNAIKDNPNCEVWYYVLGKTLRRKRRDSQFWSEPSEEEVASFLKAYNTVPNPTYGIFVAHVYREMKRFKDAEKIYNMIFQQNPIIRPTILLRLALGFMRLRNLDKAKACLDKAEAIEPKRSMYLHYRGIYYTYLKDYEEAAKFFKEACSQNNIAAEKQYLECTMELDRSYDIITHLHEMLDKYKAIPKDQIQQLMLDIALTYWKRKNDVSNALIYFLKAVEYNPEAKCITRYYVPKFLWISEKNIYQLLNRKFLPIVYSCKEELEKSSIDRAKDLQKYCDQYFSKDTSL